MSIFLQETNVAEALQYDLEMGTKSRTVICPLCSQLISYSPMGIHSHLRLRHLKKGEITQIEFMKLRKKLID